MNEKEIIKKKNPKINALISFDAILEVLDEHRPYEVDDFVPESYIPYI